MTPKPTDSPPEPADLQPGPVYPGGADAPGYRLAFQAWMLIFLTIIIVGLLTYLLGFLKSRV